MSSIQVVEDAIAVTVDEVLQYHQVTSRSDVSHDVELDVEVELRRLKHRGLFDKVTMLNFTSSGVYIDVDALVKSSLGNCGRSLVSVPVFIAYPRCCETVPEFEDFDRAMRGI